MTRWSLYTAMSVGMFMVLALGDHVAAQLAQPPIEGRTILSANRPVIFAPKPNYGLTSAGDTDTTDLTDGKLVTRANQRIWYDAAAVGWEYPGRVGFALDLGKVQSVDEVAIRLQGGAYQPKIGLPGWIEVLASEDGEHFYRVAQLWRWHGDDVKRYGIPDDAGDSWVHTVRFEKLNINSRWIGLRFYGTGLTASDEFYVFGPRPGASTDAFASPREVGEPTTFSVTRPQPHFHKPYIQLATNAVLPVPMGVATAPEPKTGNFTLEMDFPGGVEISAARIGSSMRTPQVERRGERVTYRYELRTTGNSRNWARLFIHAPGMSDGQTDVLRYRAVYDDGVSTAWIEKPLRARSLRPTPRPKHLLTTLGWWSAAESLQWPNVFESFDAIGLNGFSAFGHPSMMRANRGDSDELEIIEEARKRGYYIVHVDPPIHRMPSRQETRHQREGDGTSRQFCPSYRGPLWRAELERVAENFKAVRPHFVSFDIEIWNYRGPHESENCTRCQADFRASRLNDWDAWRRLKGLEMWRDLVQAARRGAAQGNGPRFQIGAYDWRPGHVYQHVWDFEQYYRMRLIDNAQVSTYTPYHPYSLELIGDEARKSRQGLRGSHQIPWLTPGDAGIFPGEVFRWALLENFVNGASGIYFWSSRVWDAESLIAFNEVIHALQPVEQLIVQGDLTDRLAVVRGAGRVSGMHHRGEMVLLVADYFGRTSGKVTLELNVRGPSRLRDMLTDEIIVPMLATGLHTVEIDLKGEAARLIHVQRPR